MTPSGPDHFHSALCALAEAVGDNEALVAPGRTPLHFAELLQAVEAVAATLNRLGIGRGDRVVAALPRGAESAVCFFGVASCATFAPLNPDYAEEEFDRYLARIRPRAVIAPCGDAAAIRSAARRLSIPTLNLVADGTGVAGRFEIRGDATGNCHNPGWATADDVALILLTSGSTARPKLVPNKQRHLLALVHAGKAHYALQPSDRFLHCMPMFHGHGLKSGLALPVLTGSAVICAGDFDVPSFFAAMAEFRPTWYSAGYTTQHAIVDRVQDYRDVARGAKLRFIALGSGRTDVKVIRGLEAAFDAPVLDRYSMSETGFLTSDPLPPEIRKPGSVGKAVLNEVCMADAEGNIVSREQEGEILARGPSVFEGYLDDPDANAAAFVDGWFRTGDRGRFDADGYLTITGRIKELINRGGEKIGPAEIERVLAEYPGVAQACVFGIAHPTLGQEVAAAVVPAGGALVDERSIVAFARTRLADFKVPRRVVFATALPQTATGKIDRRALAQACSEATETAAPAGDAGDSAPTSVEAAVIEIWRKLLNLEHVGTNEDFFLAGGDSLKAAELFAVIRQRFGVHVSLRQIFGEGATVRGLSGLIMRAQHENGGSRDLPKGLLPINTGGDRIALFGVPGSDGYPGSFVHLGRLIDAEQPFYGLESRGLDGAQTPLDRLEAIASTHLHALRQLQPCGPYFLIGACFGGRVAYEMARQLEAAGQTIGLVILLDPSPPFTDSQGRRRTPAATADTARGWSRFPRFVGRRLQLYAREVRQQNGAQRIAYIRAKLRLLPEMVRHRDVFRGDRSELQRIAVYEANQRAGRRYFPRPYDGPAILALTDGRIVQGPRNFRLDWLGLMPQCKAPHLVPGRDTGDMLAPPNVHVLAHCVNAWLAEAHARVGAPCLMPSDRPAEHISSTA